MKKTSLLFYFILSLVLFTACKKDSDKPQTPTTEKIAGVYRITALTAQTAGNNPVDVFGDLTECEQNDTWDFNADGTFLFGGAQGEDCGDPDMSGTWNLNGQTLTITLEGDSTPYGFISVSANELKLSVEGTLGEEEEEATYFVTFTKI